MSTTEETPKNSRWDLLVATPTLIVATLLAWQFVDLLRAEYLLNGAAEAAVREATLPKATVASVNAAANRALSGSTLVRAVEAPVIRVNQRPELLAPLESLVPGDAVSITMSVWSTDAVPDILQPIGLSLAGRKLQVTASAQKH